MGEIMKPQFKIYDWAYNKPFGDITFRTFEDAWSFIYENIADEEMYQEYEVLSDRS